MHRCSSSSSAQGNILGPCTCGLLHTQTTNSFSMLFSMPNHRPFDETEMYYSNFNSSSSSSSSSVDCTLSLGTPSTRLSNDDHHHHHHHHDQKQHHQQQQPPTRHEQRRPSSCMSNFCWDILQSKHTSTTTPSSSTHKTSRGANNNNINTACDPLVARRCANCDTTSTPLWRNGPRGPKSLCNACGIRFKKEERRASAAATTTTTNSTASSGVMEAPQHMNNNPWAVHHSQSQKIPCHSPGNDQFRFIEDDGADTGIPFLSWRLNVTDRPSLVHDFTR